jgi:hypothetical protein
MSAGGVELAGATASGGAADEEAGVKPNRRQQQLDSDIKEEILAHLRLVSGTAEQRKGQVGLLATAGLWCCCVAACAVCSRTTA